jgi:hypothetical protein
MSTREQLHAEDGLGAGLDGLEPLGHLHAAALAASTRMDLRLHHGHGAAQPLEDVDGLLRRDGHLALRHGDAVLRQDGLGLILVNLHR